MTAPGDRDDPPLAEPGKRRAGGDVGGVDSTLTSGAADWALRSSERGEAPAIGPASSGDASGGAAPRNDLGGTPEPGASGASSARSERPASDAAASAAATTSTDSAGAPSAGNDDDEEPWRHEPIAPVDEANPVKSLGKAVADTLTGGNAATEADNPKR